MLLLAQEAEGFFAETALSARRKQHARAVRALEHDLQSALQLSLELMRPTAVELLLEHRASLAKINLCVLWTTRCGDTLGLRRLR